MKKNKRPDPYSLEELSKTFSVHHEKNRKINEEVLTRYKEDYPGQPIPDHMLDEFSLPKAFKAICDAILELKNERA